MPRSYSVFEEAGERQIPLYFSAFDTPPYHFNYDDTTKKYNSYVILNEKDRYLYTQVYPTMSDSRWNVNDFIKIASFGHINKIYSNTGIDCYEMRWE
jgi:predicted NUDIX family phosphoesterase